MAAPGSFTSGSVLTAAEMNALPGGVIARVEATSNGSSSVETVQLTTPSFTAVAGRLYRITYYEPALQTPAGAGNYTFLRIRLTNVSGTIYSLSQVQNSGATAASNTCMAVAVTTLAAGSTVLVGTGQPNTGAVNHFRNASYPAFLLVEDIGPS